MQACTRTVALVGVRNAIPLRALPSLVSRSLTQVHTPGAGTVGMTYLFLRPSELKPLQSLSAVHASAAALMFEGVSGELSPGWSTLVIAAA